MKIFVERPIATAMVFLAILVLGIYSFLNIPFELAPKEEYPQLSIRTTWTGVPPEIIQTQITSPLEEIASSVKGVQKITSRSRIGSSTITLEFDPKTNMEFATLALREEISRIKDELPYGAMPSQVVPYIPDQFRTEDFLRYSISGNYTLQKLRELVKEKIEFGIGSIKGVAQVDVTGGADPEIKIILNKEKTKALNINPYQVLNAVISKNQAFPVGKIKRGSQEYIFKVHSAINETKELGETIITYSGENPVKLKDVAQVVPSYGEIYYINRINGQPTIALTVYKEPGTSTLKVAKRVKRKLEAIKKELPQNLVFRTVEDESEDIQKSLKNLYLLVGIILVVIFVLVFLILRSFKPSLLILSSIAFSVLITFNLIYFFKISLNMLTLGGLALGFGLFVDNSIVVFENVLRYREKGVPVIQAAIEGSKEVFLPVLASTLTTMSVFFSFAYFQGRLKIFYLPLAIVISSALAASLLVSFSLIPALSPKLMKKRRKERKERIRETYEKTLRFFLRHPVVVILIIVLLFTGSYNWFKKEVSVGDWFWDPSEERLRLYVGMPPGAPIERTDEVAKEFEAKVLESDYEKKMVTQVSSEWAFIAITFPPEIELSYRPYLLKEELIQLATNFAGISVSISGFDPQSYYSAIGTGTSYDSRIKFYGYNMKKLKDITTKLELTLKRNPRIKDIRSVSDRYGWYFRLDSFEYVLKIDKEALRKFDVGLRYIYYHIASLIRGRVSGRQLIKIAGEEMDLTVKIPDADQTDLKMLQDAIIRTPKGEYLRLSDITTLEERPIAGSIDRENQQFQRTIMWQFRGPSKAGEKYKKAIFSKLELPPGFSATLEETWRLSEEEKGQITFAIIFSIIIIYMILAALYESFIHPFFILLAVPLALIGVFVAFVIADFSFDSSAYIGVILLGGIVVNNSILLVDHINLRRKQGLPLLEAVLKGARERVRPIFLTTSTTVLGMFPMVLIHVEEGRRQIWSSLALSAVGGLISSTIFILIAIPIFYFYGDRIRTWGFSKLGEFKKAWKSY
ncbi:MAG: efflux RND transporter permease subunit [Candidatus Aminicenantes bacterium]|nr:efflux RND transporter permease subunit [Candidatus Aminicenantes bacterium]